MAPINPSAPRDRVSVRAIIKSLVVNTLLVGAALIQGPSAVAGARIARAENLSGPMPVRPLDVAGSAGHRPGVVTGRRARSAPAAVPLWLPAMPPLSTFVDPAQRLRELRAAWQPTVNALREMPHFSPAYEAIDALLKAKHTLTPLGGGVGSAYALSAEGGAPEWVVKPGDEDSRGPNCKGDTYTGPDALDMRVRVAVPLLTAPQRELASSLVAHALGLGGVVTKVVVMPVDFEGQPHHHHGVEDPVKLCSVARFVPGAMHAAELWPQREKLGYPSFEPDNLAKNMLLNWAIYDTDAHGRNTLVTVAGDTGMDMGTWLQLPREEQQKRPLRLTRIDTGLAMPEENRGLRNDLATDRSAQQPMSDRLRRDFLSQLTESKLRRTARQIDALGLYPDGVSRAGNAYVDRMRMLRHWLVKKPKMTLADINQSFLEAEGP